jgi:hypothetical protein
MKIEFTKEELTILFQAKEILERRKLLKTTEVNVTEPYSSFILSKSIEKPISEMLELTCNPLYLLCSYFSENGKEDEWGLVKMTMWYCPGIPNFFFCETEQEFRDLFKNHYGSEPVAAYSIPYLLDIDHTEMDIYFDITPEKTSDVLLPTIDGRFELKKDDKGQNIVSAFFEDDLSDYQIQIGNNDDLLKRITEYGYEYLSRYEGIISQSIFE